MCVRVSDQPLAERLKMKLLYLGNWKLSMPLPVPDLEKCVVECDCVPVALVPHTASNWGADRHWRGDELYS